MKKVFIKYNPYQVTTEILIDGEKPPQNSELHHPQQRLQEWVDELPDILVKESNSERIQVTFHGTSMDFDDIEDTFGTENLEKTGLRKERFEVIHEQGYEPSDQEEKLIALYKEIKHGMVEGLHDDAQLEDAFAAFQSGVFEVAVVATMSAGKSTLINALLGEQLMPSAQGNCTAIITKIRDDDTATDWRLCAYDADGNCIEQKESATIDDMRRHNECEKKPKQVELTGNIPFVSSKDMRLMLVDTPGPNNAENEEHGNVQRKYVHDGREKPLILYVMKPEYNEGDSDALLQDIASRMQDKGKQARDRFLFVLNRMDERKREDVPLEEEICKVKKYLAKKGIEDAKVFPISAQAALDIRRAKKNVQDEELQEDAGIFVKKLNNRDYLHLEAYAPLSRCLQAGITARLNEARARGDAAGEALIHSGVPSLELAICQYVRKYAKMMRIKTFASALQNKIQEKNSLETAKAQVLNNQEEYQRHQDQYDALQRKLEDGTQVQVFETQLQKESESAEKCAQESLKQLQKSFESELRRQIAKVKEMGTRVPLDKAKKAGKELYECVERMEAAFCVMVESEIESGLKNHAENLYNEYRLMLKSMASELPVLGTGVFSVSPLALVKGQLDNMKDLLKNAGYRKKVKVGEHEVEEEAAWYNLFRRIFPRIYIVEDYESRSFVDMSEFAQGVLPPVEEALYENVEMTKAHIKKQTAYVTQLFREECQKLNAQLVAIMQDLDRCAADKDGAAQRLAETQRKLAWLEEIPRRMDDILAV